MELGGEGDYNYTYGYTVTTRMTPALRWAAMSHFMNDSCIKMGSNESFYE